MMTKTIFLTKQNIHIESDEKCSVLDVLLKNKQSIDHVCDGMASCTTCVVKILKGNELLPPPTGEELERRKERNFSDNERLSCQIPALSGLEIDFT